MDNTLPVVPKFNGQLEHSSATLCDFFLINTEAKVSELVVKIVMVTKNGKKHKFPVEPGKYKMALFLLYCAVLKQSTSFIFDADLQAMLEPFFSTTTVENSRLAETSHATLQLLVLETDLEVNLVLKPGYELPKGPGRTVHKLIKHGFSQYRHLNADSPVPLIRQAIVAFRHAVSDGTIRPFPYQDRETWPSLTWQDRVWDLYNKLGMRRSI